MRVASIVVLVFIAFMVVYEMFDYIEYRERLVGTNGSVIFDVPRGAGLFRTAQSLTERKIIDKPYWFMMLAFELGVSKKLRYGEYEVAPHSSMRQLLNILSSGKTHQYSLTLVEGWRFAQVIDSINTNSNLAHSLKNMNYSEVMSMLDAPGESPEGRFFPDTYFFEKGSSDVDLLKRAYRKMQVVLSSEWMHRPSRHVSLDSPYDALILASIIEKETSKAEEQPRIAGVFLRRLQRGMRLQTDPTVIFGLGPSFAGDLSRSHLEFDTPYNTYVRAGLPPTPICLPSLLSIRAALHPEDSDVLYFVSKGNGYHQFSNSLSAHNKAVELFQKGH